jgi:hypothetical protein
MAISGKMQCVENLIPGTEKLWEEVIKFPKVIAITLWPSVKATEPKQNYSPSHLSHVRCLIDCLKCRIRFGDSYQEVCIVLGGGRRYSERFQWYLGVLIHDTLD